MGGPGRRRGLERSAAGSGLGMPRGVRRGDCARLDAQHLLAVLGEPDQGAQVAVETTPDGGIWSSPLNVYKAVQIEFSDPAPAPVHRAAEHVGQRLRDPQPDFSVRCFASSSNVLKTHSTLLT